MSEFRCIAFETSTEKSSVAACCGERIASHALDEGMASSRQVFAAVRLVLAELEMTPQDLNCVAYGCGPGSFTGVRVAAGAAQGLAFAQSLPVCSVSTLAALAVNAAGDAATGSVAACLDARMGEAYLGIYAPEDGGLRSVFADALVQPEVTRLVDEMPAVAAVGPGWAAYPDMLAGWSGTRVTDVWPDARAVLTLARRQFAAGETLAAAEALPNYLREQVTQ